MTAFLSRFVLMLGNVVTGLAVLGPAGMLPELSEGLNVGIHDTGLLVTYGAVILCFGSPLGAWLTTRLDRRSLLVGSVALVAVGQMASAFAPNYITVLVVRIFILASIAVYTPQAAATIGLIVPVKERASAIAFVLLGWPMAICVGLPMVTFIANNFGWRITYGAVGVTAAVVGVLTFFVLPKGLQGRPISLLSFVEVARNRRIMSILSLTLLQTSGQFTVFVYLAPLLTAMTGAGPAVTATVFAMYGFVGLAGNTMASIIVNRQGAERTQAMFFGAMIFGMALWTFGAGHLAVMTVGVFFWALGIAAVNGMQQARLIAASPELASASTAINTSTLYTGQAVGSGIGGLLYAHGYYYAAGYVALGMMSLGALLLALTWQRTDNTRSAA